MAITERYANFDLATGLNDGISEANAWQAASDVVAGYAAGQRVNFKKTASRHAPGAAVTFATSAGATTPIHFRGYETTIGDGGFMEWDMAANILTINGNNIIVEGFDVTGTNSQRVLDVASNAGGHVYRCKVENTYTSSGNYAAAAYVNTCSLSACYFKNANTNAAGRCLSATNANNIMHGCRIEGPKTLYFADAFYGGAFSRNLFIGTGGSPTSGLYLDRVCNQSATALLVNGNTFYNLTDGIDIEEMGHVGNSSSLLITNNLFSVMSAYGIANQESGVIDITAHIIGNAFHSTTADTDFGDVPIIGSVALTSSPFVSAGSDFKLNDTAGGGADCRAAGIPSALDPTSGTQENFLDIGALQHEDSGGGGGGCKLVGPGGGMIG